MLHIQIRMTYDEAMEYKRNLPPEILALESFTVSIVVTPADSNDFYQYLRQLPERKLQDSDAKYHSSNGQYKVTHIDLAQTPIEHYDL